MHPRFLLLWVLCALATALPQSRKSLETTKEPEELDSNSATSIAIEDRSLLFTSSATNPPLNTTTEGLLQLTQITSTAPSAVPEDDAASSTTTTTAKPESKVINVKHAADLTTAISKAGDKLVVIVVLTTWCRYSRRLDPGLEEVARSTDNVLVLKIVQNLVDTSEDWKYDDQWRLEDVDSYPYIYILKNGKKYDQYVGGNAERLQSKVNEYLTPRKE